jgi:uncharacterized protein (TIGR00369 family)
MTQPAAAERSRTFTWTDPLEGLRELAGLSGLEAMRRIAAGEVPAPPIARMLDMTVTHVEHGRAVFAIEPAEWMYNPIGSVHGGIAATILDSALGCSVHTTLEPGWGYTTTDLQVRYLRGISATTGRIVADARVTHRGGRLATAEATLAAEADGTLLAHATTGCLVIAPR